MGGVLVRVEEKRLDFSKGVKKMFKSFMP